MLTKEDVAWIKRNREEVTRNRNTSITLFHEVEGEQTDPVTGLPVPGEPTEEVVKGTFRRLTSQSTGSYGTGIVIVNGVLAEEGNAILNLAEEVDVSDVKEVIHNDSKERFRIKSRDKVGLGVLNRNYILLEKVT